MASPRWNKVGRDLVVHKVRTVLVVLSIAVGIVAAAVMLGGRAILLRTLDQSFPASEPASISFYTSPFDDLLVAEVARQDGVVRAQGRHRLDASYRIAGGDWHNITIFAVPDFEHVRIGELDRVGGVAWPKKGELLVESASASWAGLTDGQDLEFDTGGADHPTLRVTGVVHDLNATIPIMTGRAVGYISYDSLPLLDQPARGNQLDVVASPRMTETELSRLAARLRDDVIGPRGVYVARSVVHTPGKHYIADILSAVSLLLAAIGVLTLFLSGFLVVNTISSLVSQQTRQIGVMKAIGARPGQLAAMYFVTVSAYGAGALLLALPLGGLGSRWLVDFGSGVLNFLVTDYVTPTPILLLELAVGLLVPLLAASVPVVAGMRMPVRLALYSQGSSSHSFGRGISDRILGAIRGLPRPVALALRGTFKRKGRLALTLSTLTLASAMFMSVASVRSAIDETTARISQHRDYDLWVDFTTNAPAAQVERDTLQVRGVVSAETWMFMDAARVRGDGTESPPLLLYGIPAKTDYFKPEIIAGRWLEPGDTDALVVDSLFTRNEPDIGVGSTVELKTGGSPGRESLKRSWHVVGVVRGDFLQPYVYASRPYLDAITASGGGVRTVVVRTRAHDEASQKDVARRLATYLGDRGLPVGETLAQRTLQNMIGSSLNIVVVFLVIMATLLVAVGGIGLAGTMSINVLESTREIGVMRAVGASNGSIYQVFITEAVVVGLISWALGAIVAVPMSWVLTLALGDAMGFALTWGFSPAGVAAWLVFVVVISVLASLLPAYRAARVSVAEAIAYE